MIDGESRVKINSFIWKPPRGEFNNTAKFIGVQFDEKHGGRMLIAGNVEYHRDLSEGVTIQKTGPVTLYAAGSFVRSGQIQSWHSVGYSFHTPEVEQEPVTAVLESHIEFIQQHWGCIIHRAFRL